MSPCTTKLNAHAITNITTAEMMHLRVMAAPSTLFSAGEPSRFASDDHRHRTLDEALERRQQRGAERRVDCACVTGQRHRQGIDEFYRAVQPLDRRAARRAEAQQRGV